MQALRNELRNKNAYKSLIAAEYCGVKVELEKEFRMGVSDQTPLILKRDPTDEKVLVLDTPDGPLVESNTMARYVAKLKGDNALCGSSVYENFDAIVNGSLKKALITLNTHLATNTYYLVGQNITLADIVLICELHFGFTSFMTKSFTSEFPHVERYFWTLISQPEFKKILGEVKQTESVPPLPVWGPVYEVKVDEEMIKEKRRRDMENEMNEQTKRMSVV
ncbi:hypothetical protein LUZ60_005252 [Juncus effusus]|nr:hypothetical protein LUZ60_005252 [Juncus effusus]